MSMTLDDIPDTIKLTVESGDEVFEAPFHNVLHKKLLIENRHDVMGVRFWVGPGTPQVFLVRPSSGCLGPNQEVTVDIFADPPAPDVDDGRNSVLVQVVHVLDEPEDEEDPPNFEIV